MTFFFQIVILIINLFELIINQSICNYNDCFNCSLCGNEKKCDCEWSPNGRICKKEKEKSPFNYNFDYFSSCYDEESLRIQKNYCGNTYIQFKEENIATINLIENDGSYAAQNLYCEYIYDDLSQDVKFYYNLKIVISPLVKEYMKTLITITYIDNKSDKKTVTGESFEEEFKKIKRIKIQIYFENLLYKIPLSIKITKLEEKKNYNLYISIAIIIGACIICAIIIICVSRKAAQNARRRQEIYLQIARENQRRREEQLNRIRPGTSFDPSSSSESEISIIEINTQKIQQLLKSTLLPIKYYKYLGAKNGNSSSLCTICIEEFKEGKSKVSFTPCQHVFHYKCLKDWLMKNVLNPKCPNCNYNLLKEDKNILIKSQGAYEIPELPCNVRRSNDRKVTNIQEREPYDNHNNSINMETNGLDTGENRFINRNETHKNQNNCIRSVSINISKSGNAAKNNNKDENKSNKEEEEIDEVVIENIENIGSE